MLVKDYSKRFVKSINAPAEAKQNVMLVPVSFFGVDHWPRIEAGPRLSQVVRGRQQEN